MKPFRPGELVKCKIPNGTRLFDKEFEVPQGTMNAREMAVVLSIDGDFPAYIEILTSSGIKGWILDISIERCK